jgi:hypothetical protein
MTAKPSLVSYVTAHLQTFISLKYTCFTCIMTLMSLKAVPYAQKNSQVNAPSTGIGETHMQVKALGLITYGDDELYLFFVFFYSQMGY